MSNIQYGLISRVDSNTIEKTFDLIFEQFPNEVINYTEVGLYNGRTANGVKEYLVSKGKQYNITGIDNFKDGEMLVFFPEDAKLIQGSSIEVYNQLADNSQHLLIIDGNHSFPYVVADFWCFRKKIKRGAYLCFHDASPQTQGKSWQRMGNDLDSDMNIAVMKALNDIGLIGENNNREWLGFELICHEWDENDAGGGVIIFKRLL